MNSRNKEVISEFIEEIWNRRNFNTIPTYLHHDFVDHSLTSALPSDKEGMIKWITATGESFEHKTVIEDIVCEGDIVIIRIQMHLRHIGKWRGITATGKNIIAIGYRHFKLVENKIVAHWALIDGAAIENQLKEITHGCEIKV